jgi:Tol biopolymer transport system component
LVDPTAAGSPLGDAEARIVVERSSGLYSMDHQGREQRRLTVARGPDPDYVPQWSPDGSKIAFLRFAEGHTSLWVMRSDGSNQRKVAGDVAEYYDWAPDSRWLAYTRRGSTPDAGAPPPALLAVRADGSDTRTITNDERVLYAPDWSPDGAAIAFTGITKENGEYNQDIYVADVASGDVQRLTTDPAHDWEPRWAPDSTTIAFISARNDPYDSEYGPYTSGLFVIDADGSSERQLTPGDETDDREHAWSPDGSRLVYVQGWDDDVAPVGAASTLRIVPLDGPSEALAAGRSVGEPDWSPTGAWIVYQRDDRPDSEIYKIRPGGGEPQPLTDNDEHDSRADW